jgi:hypothetical protein
MIFLEAMESLLTDQTEAQLSMAIPSKLNIRDINATFLMARTQSKSRSLRGKRKNPVL